MDGKHFLSSQLNDVCTTPSFKRSLIPYTPKKANISQTAVCAYGIVRSWEANGDIQNMIKNLADNPNTIIRMIPKERLRSTRQDIKTAAYFPTTPSGSKDYWVKLWDTWTILLPQLPEEAATWYRCGQDPRNLDPSRITSFSAGSVYAHYCGKNKKIFIYKGTLASLGFINGLPLEADYLPPYKRYRVNNATFIEGISHMEKYDSKKYSCQIKGTLCPITKIVNLEYNASNTRFPLPPETTPNAEVTVDVAYICKRKRKTRTKTRTIIVPTTTKTWLKSFDIPLESKVEVDGLDKVNVQKIIIIKKKTGEKPASKKEL